MDVKGVLRVLAVSPIRNAPAGVVVQRGNNGTSEVVQVLHTDASKVYRGHLTKARKHLPHTQRPPGPAAGPPALRHSSNAHACDNLRETHKLQPSYC